MIFLDIFLGIIVGFILGLVPSFHINVLAYLLLLLGAFRIFPNNFYLFFSIAITMTVVGILPLLVFKTTTADSNALFLGHSWTNFLPSLQGFLFGAIFSVLLLPLFYFLFVLFSEFYIFIFIILFLTLLFLVFQEKNRNGRIVAITTILLSGILGVVTLKYNFFFSEPLLPCIFGLFALPTLIYTLFSRGENQANTVQYLVSIKSAARNSFLGALFSCVIAIIPSLSPGIAMIFPTLVEKENFSEKQVLLSSTLISVILIYFFMAAVFRKSRIGYVSILLEQQIFQVFSIPDIFLMCFVFLFVTAISCLLLFFSFKRLINVFSTFSKTKTTLFVIFFSIILIILITDIFSIFLIFLSCAIGALPIVYNKNKLLLMSYLIVPTILFFV